MWAESGLPAILSLDIYGNVDALTDPSSLILSQSVAKALFGDDDPIGKTVRVDNKADMKVGAVYQDLPANTTLTETKFLLSGTMPPTGAIPKQRNGKITAVSCL